MSAENASPLDALIAALPEIELPDGLWESVLAGAFDDTRPVDSTTVPVMDDVPVVPEDDATDIDALGVDHSAHDSGLHTDSGDETPNLGSDDHHPADLAAADRHGADHYAADHYGAGPNDADLDAGPDLAWDGTDLAASGTDQHDPGHHDFGGGHSVDDHPDLGF